jgi:aconitase B
VVRSAAPGRSHHPQLSNRMVKGSYRRHWRRQPHALIGISFPAGSGLRLVLPCGAADMPESVLGAFLKAKCSSASHCSVTCQRDSAVRHQGRLLTVAKQGKKNIFSGRISNEGLPT